jgi:hypothetical protein
MRVRERERERERAGKAEVERKEKKDSYKIRANFLICSFLIFRIIKLLSN